LQSLELEFRPQTIDALRAELPNLLKRRAFVAGAECTEMRTACGLAIVHPVTGARLLLPAEVVWAEPKGPGKGVGVELRAVDAGALTDYAGVVGQLLAKGHARTSGASMIAGYLGSSDRVDKALCKFARRYADQTEADHATLVAAVERGLLPVERGV